MRWRELEAAATAQKRAGEESGDDIVKHHAKAAFKFAVEIGDRWYFTISKNGRRGKHKTA